MTEKVFDLGGSKMLTNRAMPFVFMSIRQLFGGFGGNVHNVWHINNKKLLYVLF